RVHVVRARGPHAPAEPLRLDVLRAHGIPRRARRPRRAVAGDAARPRPARPARRGRQRQGRDRRALLALRRHRLDRHLHTRLSGAVMAHDQAPASVATYVKVAGLGAAWLAGCRPAQLPLPRGRAATFLGGLLALTAALNGPLHDLAERSLVSAHMTQHLVLILIAAPCLLAGMPAELIDALLT